MKNAILSGSMPRRNVIGRFVENNSKTIVEVISALFILLFVYTALSKLIVVNDLIGILKNYPIIGTFNEFIAWALPISELFISLMLLMPRLRISGLYLSLGMMIIFTLYLAYMLIFTPKLPCTCGGMLQKLSWPQHLVFNLILILLAFLGIYILKTDKKNNKIKLQQPQQIIFT